MILEVKLRADVLAGEQDGRWPLWVEHCLALPVPERTPVDAELWITMEGWDGTMHQGSIPLSQASPATIAWLNKQGVKP